MCETEVSCPYSKSQPGVRGLCKGPSGAFVTYCIISCLNLISQQSLARMLSYSEHNCIIA